ncbi:unnamed protein product [Didymodactylos carnosus]|uniref:Caspase family p20 domain-containing protein n=1 Tax=Didymodactylos carnosus TaxID=1234261 RepID=A0A814UYX3_9BILA|nr:unnamed protein product [Didymodactylos carnosus]CAF1181119.1 unnamed protein product [Didymodactylos carnosus]CAF3945414.1 unnamed protein product [Didymodactylos carnosus]CAF3976804.1 unnamed protein product [Didymodactylos carnosus]
MHTTNNPRKLALIIGNNKYTQNPLKNCVNDANDLSRALESIEFHVTKKTDLIYREMDQTIDRFVRSIQPNDFVVFFFSGHGTQWEDQNYLLPCDDDRIYDQNDMKYHAINAQRVLEKMSAQDPYVIVFLLDCCRNYCVPNAARSRSILPSGLNQMIAPSGSLIAFACAPGQTASDGSSNNRNGMFTTHLLKHITREGEDIEMVLRDVAYGVETETNKKQRPYRTSCITKTGVYLVPPSRNPNGKYMYTLLLLRIYIKLILVDLLKNALMSEIEKAKQNTYTFPVDQHDVDRNQQPNNLYMSHPQSNQQATPINQPYSQQNYDQSSWQQQDLASYYYQQNPPNQDFYQQSPSNNFSNQSRPPNSTLESFFHQIGASQYEANPTIITANQRSFQPPSGFTPNYGGTSFGGGGYPADPSVAYPQQQYQQQYNQQPGYYYNHNNNSYSNTQQYGQQY